METHLPSEALERRARSEAVLHAEGVPINAHLPVIETAGEVTLRSAEAVAYRTLSLLMVALVAKTALEGDSYDLKLMADALGVEQQLSEDEFAYILSLYEPNPDEEDSEQFIWRYEAAWTLLWALGHVKTLDPPTDICYVEYAESFIFAEDPGALVRDAKLRPPHEILDQADLIYRYHWAVRDAEVRGLTPPAGLSGSVVRERHHALNWLVGYMEQEWDEVSTDT